MSHIISMTNSESVDVDTFDGQYKCVAHYLTTHGADSQTFSCLVRMKSSHDFAHRKIIDIFVPEL